MTTFTRATPGRPLPDLTKHVNYVYGMVLGVEDFIQEFAYHSGRHQALARDLAGYGTICGLRVRYETAYEGPDRGPRLSVSPGAAISPSGQVVCVAPAQCAYLVEWLAANRDDVVAALGGPPPPAAGQLDLSLTLCYADCPTDEVPIPGEPCRSEDDLMAPSRLRDQFLLELRFPPGVDQHEEDAVRRFAAWLRQVPVTDGAAGTLADFLAEIRTAAKVGLPPPQPECPPVADFLAAPPAAGLAIPRADAMEYWRAAFRLWVTELLPCWRVLGPDCGCGSAAGEPTAESLAGSDCVTLARLRVDVQHDPVEDRLLVGPAGVEVQEDTRAYLVDLRLLQEWALTDPPAPPAPPVVATVVAAGWFDPQGQVPNPPFFSRGGLVVTPNAAADAFDLTFDGFDPAAAADYLISGSAVVDPAAAAHVVEVVTPGPGGGLAVRVRRATGSGANIQGFQLQITRYGG